MSINESQTRDTLLNEIKIYPPSKNFSDHARINSMDQYEEIYRHSMEQPDQFWAHIAGELHWMQTWKSVLTWKEPYAKWFLEGKTNVSYNCLDRHLPHYAEKTALIWQGEPDEKRQLSYRELLEAVCQFSNGLKKLGIKKGDCITLYMPLIPELIIAVLACARLGSIHNVVFGGYSVQALESRIQDSNSKLVITADAAYRRGKIIPIKQVMDEALLSCPLVEKVIVYQRTQTEIPLKAHRDIGWHDVIAEVSDFCPAEPMDSEDTLFILYTSGSTGEPKGIFHSTGGYMVGAYYTSKIVFDLKPEDVYWCTADVGWITGHTYVVYGPLLNAATVFIYEGAPDWPKPDRFWQLIEEYKVNIFYTAPTAIRSFMKWGNEWVDKKDLSSLRLLGSVGEPLNPEAWLWYFEKIGNKQCPIVDTWWQTETGAIMIASIPGAIPTKPGSVAKPLPGVEVDIVDTATGLSVEQGKGGALIIRRPWPSMLRGIWNDPKRYEAQYWGKVPHAYFSGDGARFDTENYIWIIGRTDDVIKVSGHRLGTAEIEAALDSYPAVAESAVVPIPDKITGQSIVAFVVLNNDVKKPTATLKADIINQVRVTLGAIALPKRLIFTVALPKTRSGKIMRRLLQDIAVNREIEQDTSTLEDFSVLKQIQEQQMQEQQNGESNNHYAE
ncbi:acetate--CoA ligase [Rickettsiella endosymbiont of Litargus connexus]|uniref:acetate--CoA ligase n=1 Tax=Rickettsiella endosymbiont of Litargus connexus TaxID=3066237 RepID=UPI00376ECA2E